MEIKRKDMGNGVEFIHLKSERFKTNILSCCFLVPVRKETLGADGLLPTVLRRGSKKYPDRRAIGEALDLLYGVELGANCRRKAEYLCIGMSADCIDDRFAPGGEKLLEPVAAMMGELLFRPLLENGAFSSEYVAQEKENMVNEVRARMNDKRQWADYRLLRELCSGEPYGVFIEEEDVKAITPESLYARYRDILSTAPVKVIYCGSADFARAEAATQTMLRDLPRYTVFTLPPILPHTLRPTVQTVRETMRVEQGKLAMGFSAEGEDTTALMLANLMFGGTSNARLFLNVREKLSLCYYVSTLFHQAKRVITLSGGIATKDYDRTCEEIMRQLRFVQEGKIEPWEFAAAKSAARGSLRSAEDDLERMESYLLGEAALGTYRTLAERLERSENTELDAVVAAANAIKLDTVYFLAGKEAVK